jgi:hypothetical protein
VGVLTEVSSRDVPDDALAELGHAIATTVAAAHDVSVDTVLFCQPGTLPRTTSGKKQRRRAADLLEAGALPTREAWTSDSRANDALGAPTTRSEKALARVFAEVFSLPAFLEGIRFLASGATPSRPSRSSAAIEAQLGVKVDPGWLLAIPHASRPRSGHRSKSRRRWCRGRA